MRNLTSMSHPVPWSCFTVTFIVSFVNSLEVFWNCWNSWANKKPKKMTFKTKTGSQTDNAVGVPECFSEKQSAHQLMESAARGL